MADTVSTASDDRLAAFVDGFAHVDRSPILHWPKEDPSDRDRLSLARRPGMGQNACVPTFAYGVREDVLPRPRT